MTCLRPKVTPNLSMLHDKIWESLVHVCDVTVKTSPTNECGHTRQHSYPIDIQPNVYYTSTFVQSDTNDGRMHLVHNI